MPPPTPVKPGLHHIALVCRDVDETHHFYQDLLQFPLVHTEIHRPEEGGDGWFRHFFYDLGDGSYLAFFDLHGIGDRSRGKLRTGISTGLGLPIWANHVALRSDSERAAATKDRLQAEGLRVDERDHGWCRSLYVVDPNRILVELTVDTPGFEPDRERALELLHAGPETVDANR